MWSDRLTTQLAERPEDTVSNGLDGDGWLTTITDALLPHLWWLAIAAVALLLLAVVLIARASRGRSNFKLKAGNTVVQAGVTWAVVTGTYAFCERYFQLPRWESLAFAVFFEAATWVTVGMVIAHGRAKTTDGQPTTGFGPAGPFFYLFSSLGGILAVTGGDTPGAMIGRAVVVAFGTCLWYLTLLTYTRRSDTPGRFRWTPRRLLVAIGAIEPADQDLTNQHHEWQVRRMARAMRWANSRPPWKWLGERALVSRAEQTDESVISTARRRYAVAHLLVDTVTPESDVMKRVIGSVKAEVGRGDGLSEIELLAAKVDELTETARRAEAEKVTAASEARRLAQQIASLTASRDQEVADRERAFTALQERYEALVNISDDALRTASREHAQALSDLAEKHAEDLARVRAESATVNLTRYRETHPEKRTRQQPESASRRVLLTDEEAAQKCIDEHPEPDFAWSYRTVATTAGVAQKRAPEIIALIEKHHANSAERGGGKRASDTANDDTKERSA